MGLTLHCRKLEASTKLLDFIVRAANATLHKYKNLEVVSVLTAEELVSRMLGLKTQPKIKQTARL
jgi:hypothetical protein